MPGTTLDIASQGPATPVSGIVVKRDRDAYRLSLLVLCEGTQEEQLAFAATLDRAQVTALAGMLSTLLDGSDPHAVEID